ncbi:MAG TPA: hypothetical protein VM912_18280 [Terriglobales bacterium]|nr:hypothetical protein [Terriglobales bacterium]
MAQPQYIPQRYMKMPVNPVDNWEKIRFIEKDTEPKELNTEAREGTEEKSNAIQICKSLL